MVQASLPILGSIDAISTRNWAQLLEIPFTSLTLVFDTGRKLNVKRASSTTTISLTGEEQWKLDYDLRMRREAVTVRQVEVREVERELEAIENYLSELNDAGDEYETRRLDLLEHRAMLMNDCVRIRDTP